MKAAPGNSTRPCFTTTALRLRWPAGSVTWSVQSGPLTGISASGLATAAAVYQDTAAVARGTYQTFTATLNLTVLNTLPDNFRPTPATASPTTGRCSISASTIPTPARCSILTATARTTSSNTTPASFPPIRLSLFSMSIADVAGGGHAITFSPRLAGCTYTLLGSSDLSLWAPVAGTITDAGTVAPFSIPPAPEAGASIHQRPASVSA